MKLVTLPVVADTIYHIVVDGYGGLSGLAYVSLVSGFGDVNADTQVDLSDAIVTLQILSGTSLSSDISIKSIR